MEGKASLEEITERWSVLDLVHANLMIEVKQAELLSIIDSVTEGFRGAGKPWQ